MKNNHFLFVVAGKTMCETEFSGGLYANRQYTLLAR